MNFLYATCVTLDPHECKNIFDNVIEICCTCQFINFLVNNNTKIIIVLF